MVMEEYAAMCGKVWQRGVSGKEREEGKEGPRPVIQPSLVAKIWEGEG